MQKTRQNDEPQGYGMSNKYVTLPAPNSDKNKKEAATATYWDGTIGMIHMPDSVTVMEQEMGPQHTGLLDAHGRPLYRVPERLPMGFHIRK